MEDLVKCGLDGIEVWTPYADNEKTEHIINLADKYNLVKTGGSDFHGMYSKSVCPVGSCTTPKEQLENLIKRKNNLFNF